MKKFKFLYKINPIRLKYILSKCNGIFGKKILDVGCGIGILAESMSKEGGIVTGIDISKSSLEIAKKSSSKKKINIKYLNETVEEHVKNINYQYDIITCMEVLEHVKNPELIIKNCSNLLKNNGHIFISTINRNIKSWFFIIFLAEYIFHFIPKKTHNLKNFIKPEEILSWTDKTNLTEKEIIGINFNFFKNKFFIGNNIKINYLVYFKKEVLE